MKLLHSSSVVVGLATSCFLALSSNPLSASSAVPDSIGGDTVPSALGYRRLDSLSVDETVALLDSWGLGPFFGPSFRRLSVDGEMLGELEADDISSPEAARAFPEAHSIHKKKLLRKLAQLGNEGDVRVVNAAFLSRPSELSRDEPIEVELSSSDGGIRRSLAASGDDDGPCEASDLDAFSGLHVKKACAAVSLGSAHDVRFFRNRSGVGIVQANAELHLDSPQVVVGASRLPIATADSVTALNVSLTNTQTELDDVENSVNKAIGSIHGTLDELASAVSVLEGNVALVFDDLAGLAALLSNHTNVLGLLQWVIDPCASSPCNNGGSCFVPSDAAPGDFACDCTDAYEGPTCDSYAASSCQHVLNSGLANGDGLYDVSICNDGVNHTVYCQFNGTDGWTMLGSFVNTDSAVSWSRPDGYGAWVDNSTFGGASSYRSADYKSSAFFCMKVSDIMLSDAYGWVSFSNAINNGNGDPETLRTVIASYSSCQTVPLVSPGSSSVDSSSKNFKEGAMLTFFAGDPNSANRCAFSGTSVHSDSTTLAIGGAGCGSTGAGQWGTNYNSGMDWHLRIDDDSTCIACDSCGEWNGVAAVTSSEHNNNAGVHDESTYGVLWAK